MGRDNLIIHCQGATVNLAQSEDMFNRHEMEINNLYVCMSKYVSEVLLTS